MSELLVYNLTTKNRVRRFGLKTSIHWMKLKLPIFLGSFLYLYDMKLLNVLKSLIVESKLIDKFTLDGIDLEIRSTMESEMIAPNSKTGRVNKDEILESMSDIYDVIIEQAMIVTSKEDGNSALLISDYWLGFDYQLWVKLNKNKLTLTINTSIRHPKLLSNKKFCCILSSSLLLSLVLLSL